MKPTIIKDFPEFAVLKEPAMFQMVKVEPRWYGVSWNEDLDCSEWELWENGIEVPLSARDFVSFAKHEIINTAEVANMLGCTRQNVAAAITNGHIKPVKTYQRTTLFLRSDVVRAWHSPWISYNGGKWNDFNPSGLVTGHTVILAVWLLLYHYLGF